MASDDDGLFYDPFYEPKDVVDPHLIPKEKNWKHRLEEIAPKPSLSDLGKELLREKPRGCPYILPPERASQNTLEVPGAARCVTITLYDSSPLSAFTEIMHGDRSARIDLTKLPIEALGNGGIDLRPSEMRAAQLRYISNNDGRYLVLVTTTVFGFEYADNGVNEEGVWSIEIWPAVSFPELLEKPRKGH